MLRDANLQGVLLYDANLQRAYLNEANLQGADVQEAYLTDVEGLVDETLKRARNWPLAYYSKESLVSLGLPPDHNKRVRSKNLSGYQLQGTNLQGAFLGGANLLSSAFCQAAGT